MVNGEPLLPRAPLPAAGIRTGWSVPAAASYSTPKAVAARPLHQTPTECQLHALNSDHKKKGEEKMCSDLREDHTQTPGTEWLPLGRLPTKSTTTSSGSDFYLSENERPVLAEPASKAWLYRAERQPDGRGTVQRIQDPISRIPVDAMRPVIWRLSPSSLAAGS